MHSLTSILAGTALSLAASTAVAAAPWETLPAPAPLPALQRQGVVEHAGARIWYGVVGAGKPVVLLHGGRASSLGWGNQVPALLAHDYQVILVESRGHGRSTLGATPLSYRLMGSDVLAVMDALALGKAALVGWSDGANTAITLAMTDPQRIDKVVAFGPNVNMRFLTPPAPSPLFGQVEARLQADYAALGGDPAGFARLSGAVRAMQAREPDYSDAELAAIQGPAITILGADHDEFISLRHFSYIAATIPAARLAILPDVSHFAPWQDADGFNRAMLKALEDRP